MKVYTNIEYVWDEEQNKLVETSSESHDYEGRVDRAMPAGPFNYDIGAQYGDPTPSYNQPYAGVYNYWLNLLPPDVLQEMMGIFSDPIGQATSFANIPYADWYTQQTGETSYGTPGEGEEAQWAQDIGSWYTPLSQTGVGSSGSEYSWNFMPYMDIMSGEQIGMGLSEALDLDADVALTPQTALTPELVKRLQTSYYRPMIETNRANLIAGMQPELAKAKSLGKGFAGYGGRAKAEGGLWDQFSAGMGQSFGQVDQLRGQARGEIGDIMNQWRQAMETA